MTFAASAPVIDEVLPTLRLIKPMYIRVYDFTGHVSRILKRVYYIISTLSFIVPYFKLEVRMKVFNTYILPHIIYAVPVWYHFLLVKDQKRFRAFLHYCAKILSLDFNSLINQVNNAAMRDFKRLAYKIQRDENHPLHNELKSLLRQTSYNLRNRNITPKFRTVRFKNSFVYRAAILIQGVVPQNLL